MEYLPDEERAWFLGQEPESLVVNELQRAREDGRNPAAEAARYERMRGAASDSDLLALYEETLALPADPAVRGFAESGLDAILAALPPSPPASSTSPAGVDRLEDRMLGAWSGRVAGNLAGKPVEVGWDRRRTREYLGSTGAYPLLDYVPPPPAGAPDPGLWRPEGTLRGEVHGSVRDDDVDYTVLGLHLLETYGAAYTRRDVAIEWLRRLPVYATYTAERAVYQNLVREVPFEAVGEFRNPFQEWIGALIRADVFGFVRAGDPRAAAVLAFEDAALSHRANGVYGELWAAALIASAFTAASPAESLEVSLAHVPPGSRLAAELRAVQDDRDSGLDWETAMDRIEARHPGMHWVHTITNAGALAAALLWGDGDFSATVGLAVQSGLDTDSIGATAGSWAGAFLGASGIPSHWSAPLEDTVRSAIVGFGEARITDLAGRTLALRERLAG